MKSESTPADVSWNKPFKAKSQAFYGQRMLDSGHETTATGNPKPPPPELYLKFMLEASYSSYNGVTKDSVINSFKACSIGAIGGADDLLIHFQKEGSGIPNGLYELKKQVRQ
ncbi:pogo transposable element with KRAB domain-like protein [Aphelenchoides avenae]|nr:pogo transposable element with KRAB domain-like protein [Aphelenchus avenae]